MRNKRGITLIALVITIIVLLILAAVSIQAITGENGIATKAKTAKEQSVIGTEKEQIKLSYSSCKLDKTEDLNEEITASELEDKMNDSYGSGTVEVTGNGLLTVFYTETEREYLVLANGNVLDKDETLKNLTYENAVGIAEDGSLVDMTLWMYEYMDETESYFVGCYWYSGFHLSKVYKGDFIDGKIEGEIPAYIFDLRYAEEFLPVTSLRCAFFGRDELVYAPRIPSTVTDISSIFAECVNLKEAPQIPKSVTTMQACFVECENLTGIMEINANPSSYYSCFDGTSINENCELILTGSSTMLEEILTTKSDNSNIRIEN